jgi:hypothetical protein
MLEHGMLEQKENAGIVEYWNIGKGSEIGSLWFLFARIIPSFQYSIIPTDFTRVSLVWEEVK